MLKDLQNIIDYKNRSPFLCDSERLFDEFEKKLKKVLINPTGYEVKAENIRIAFFADLLFTFQIKNDIVRVLNIFRQDSNWLLNLDHT